MIPRCVRGLAAALAITAALTMFGASPVVAVPLPQIAVTSLELQQSISLQELPVGSRTEVEIKVTNSGNSAASGVALRADLPSGLIHLTSDPGGVIDGASVLWDLGNIPAGEFRLVDVTLRATRAGTLTHRVAVRSDATDEISDNAIITVTNTGLSPGVTNTTTTPATTTTSGPISADASGTELARTGNTTLWLFVGAAGLVVFGVAGTQVATRAPAMASLIGPPRRRRRRTNRPVFHPVRSSEKR